MGKEIFAAISNQENLTVGKTDFSLDLEEKVDILSRKYCIPDEEVYKDNPTLKNNPVRAASHVMVEGLKVDRLPIEGQIAVGAAKIKAASENLKLSPKQSEYFDGVIENTIGSIPFISGPASEVIKRAEIAKGHVVKEVAKLFLVTQMALTACTGPVNTNSVAESTSSTPTPIVEMTNIPGFIPVSEAGSLTPTENIPYPSSEQNFDTITPLQGADAEAAILKLGQKVVDQYNAMKAWYSTHLDSAGKKDIASMEAEYFAGANGIHWDLAAKAANGNYLKFTLTSGSEKGQVVRAMAMASYSDEKPTFETSELTNPTDFPNATQKMIWDSTSGWSVIGLFQGNNLVGWFNADAQNGGMWEMLPNAATPIPQSELTGPESTSTPEAYPTTLSANDVKAALALDSNADTWTSDNSQYITDLVAKRTALWNSLGLNLTDSTKPDYVTPKFVMQKDAEGNITNWDYVLYGKDGGVAQWLQVKDDSTGNWQWGKTDMWDPNLSSVEGESQYSLPDKLSSTVKVTKDASGNSVVTLGSSDKYDIVFVGKNEVLVEFDKDGNPKRWLDKTTGKMEWIDGVDKIDYITPDGGSILLTDARKIAGINGEDVGFTNSSSDSHEQLLYFVALFKGFGFKVGGPPGYGLPSSIVSFSGDSFVGNDGKSKYGAYFRESTGQGFYIFRDTSGAIQAVQNLTR